MAALKRTLFLDLSVIHERTRAGTKYLPKVDSQQILSFYMGKDTRERKDYITGNVVVTVEE
jgi:hypothetical protein